MEKARLMVTLVVEKKENVTTIVSKKKKSSTIQPLDDDDSSTLTNSSQDSDSSDEDQSSPYEFEIETGFRIEKYRPVTIIAQKLFQGQDVGVQFKLVKTRSKFGGNADNKGQTWICVKKISKDSIFADNDQTNNAPILQEGDKIISINDVDMRGGDATVDPRRAHKACSDTKESILMVVLKNDESIFFQKSFCFDASVTNLDWMK